MRRRRALLPLLALPGALAACGGGPASNGVAAESPAQILQAGVNAMRSAKSVHIKGTVGSGSQTITIDAVSFSNGDLDGTIGQNGATAQVVKIGGTDYFNGAASFWTTSGSASTALAAQLADRWISTKDGQGTPGIGTTFTMSALAAGLSEDNGTITKGSTGSVDGQPAISITSSNGGTLWIATTGTPYVLEATGSGSGSSSGSVTFTDWDQGTVPSPPAGAVAASSLTGPTGSGTTTTTSGLTGSTGTGTTVPGTSGATGATGTGATGATGATGTGAATTTTT